MNFKFVSSGQSVDDAAIISQTFQGNSLKPLRVSNVRGYRAWDPRDIGIEWTRASRLGAGMIPYSDVPLGEQEERYDIDIMSGSTVKRTISTLASAPQPVLWEVVQLTVVTFGGDQGISFVTGPNILLSRQVFNASSGEMWFSFSGCTNGATGPFGLATRIGFISVNSLVGSPSNWTPDIGFLQSGATVPTTTGLATNVNLESLDRSHLLIKIHGGQAALYQDPQGLNLGAPIGNQVVSLSGNYRILLLDTTDFSQILKPRCWRSDVPSTSYIVNDQIADFGSQQSSVTVRVSQVSAVVGRGAYTEATI